MNKQYRSNIMAAVHETAEDLHDGGLMDKFTMREFDELCLTPIRHFVPEEIRQIRERESKCICNLPKCFKRNNK